MALDGLAEFAPRADAEDWSPRVNLANLDAFFQPRGIAVIGVSADLSKYSLARDIAELLHELRHGDLYLVNPHGGTLRFGDTEYPLYRDLAELPAPVELAVYAAPAQAAPEFLRALAGGSVRAVVLIPGVPSSIPYAQYARELRDALPAGIRIMGPNCMGVYHAAGREAPGINTLFINEKRLEVRSSARGQRRAPHPERRAGGHGDRQAAQLPAAALGGELREQVRRERGRAAGVFRNATPRWTWWPCTWKAWTPGRAALSSTGRGNPPSRSSRTRAAARKRARAPRPPTPPRCRGTTSVFRAACQQAGVILAETIEEYYDLMKTFSLLAARPPRGNRVAGVVNAGFESTVGADELQGLTQAKLGAPHRGEAHADQPARAGGHLLPVSRHHAHGGRRDVRAVRGSGDRG